MRLHSLEVTAFGPFTDTVRVDFDALSDAGLFLLTGATGAGKSSVLDAVCFALYGDVPGDRGTAKRLRSDQAPADRGPRVVLEVTLAGRRFRIDRSPAWERPKKRGTGTTVQQASVAISEQVAGGWTTRSTRLDETGHLVTALVGMNLPQFCQVALLPQGRFQAFLRAKSEERHALLSQVFRTGRFEAVERWLRERRASTRRESQTHEQAVADLLSRVSESAAVDLPEAWEDLATAADTDQVAAWSMALLEAAGDDAATAQVDATAAHTGVREARSSLDQARVLVERQAAHRAAISRLDALAGLEAEHAARVSRLDGARRSAAVAPLLRAADEAERRHATAREGAERTLSALGVGGPGALAELTRRTRALAARCAEVSGALPRAEQLETLTRELDECAGRLTHASQHHDEITSELDALPGRIEASRGELASAATAEAALPGAREQLRRLEDRLAAARLVITLLPQRERATAEHATARGMVHEAREQWLEIREARLEGMASELAGRLAAGGCCPVCGSAEHPHPAAVLDGAPDAAAEKAARRALDDAESLLQAHDERVRELDTRLLLAREQAGESSAQALATQIDEESHLLSNLSATAAGRARLEGEVRELEERRSQLEATRRGAADAVHQATSAADDVARRLDACRSEVSALLEGTEHTTLPSLLASLEAEEADVTRALAAVHDRDGAAQALDRALEAATTSAHEAGFVSCAHAAAAVLTPVEVARLEKEVVDHMGSVAAATAAAADPALVAASTVPPPDVEGLATALRAAETGAAVADRALVLATGRDDRLQGLHRQLAQALAAWLPVRRDHDLATRMAALVEGTASDNRLQMRLSAYVLAHRLGQVVDAANERLATMADQRYSLEHTARRGAGETRGGLSLLVRDDWSGEARDPATLSGGETFVVSLALALGLADVITQEAGGADLDTLFVDEGFGSLDAETLDHVMDTLDALRDGGRVVGVVSHVDEMRDRIPAQLRVIKQRAGSSLTVHAGAVG